MQAQASTAILRPVIRPFLLALSLSAAAPGTEVPQPPAYPELGAAIERECGLGTGTIAITGERVELKPRPDEAFERVDCALAKLRDAGHKLGFVGNEADPDAVLHPPLRYIVAGPAGAIAALVRAAEADKWDITLRAAAPDGTAVVQFESGKAMTHGEADRLIHRIWNKDFGDIAFGAAPGKLSEPISFGE